MIIKTFIIVVLLAGFNGTTGQKELMVFPTPVFDNVDTCKDFVSKAKESLIYRTWQHYGPKPVENIFCAPEDEALAFIKPKKKKDWTDGVELPPLNLMPGLDL
jgi:hypothetical protein